MSTAEIKAAPTAQEYADAFYGLEDKINSLRRHATLVDYLVGRVSDSMDKRLLLGDATLLDIAYGAVRDLHDEVHDLDQSYLDRINDLVGRENAARGFPS